MITLLSLISLGFFLGMRHATDPDHVLAVSTIVTRQRTLRAALLIGILWGVGHTLTIVVVGAAIILFSVVIPPRLGLTMEMAVALMLVVLGMWNLTRVLQRIREALTSRGARTGGLHMHPHTHGDYVHSHSHGHEPDDHGHRDDQTPQAWLDRRLGRLGLYHLVRPLVVGLLHGLAGSGAVALLVLFGLGTIVGMMLITVAVAAPMLYTARRLSGIDRRLRIASGLLSLGFGLFLVYQIGFVHGLFTGRPSGSPE